MKVCIIPTFSGEDTGDGGVRRAVESQRRWFPQAGVTIVDTPDEADIIVVHIAEKEKFFNRYPDKPLVIDCHGLYWSEYLWPRWSHKINVEIMAAMRCSDHIIAHSEWVANAVRRHTLREVDVVPLSVDLDEWAHNDAPDEGYVLWNKNRPDAVCDPLPVAQLAERMLDVDFVTTYYPADAEPRSNVTVTERLPYKQAQEVLRRADIYLCTTRETFGVGTLEALAAGVPVVGWAWGGQREFLTHRENAWLAKPGDIDGLAEGIRHVREHRQSYVEAGRALVETFAPERIAKQYVSVLKRVLKEHRAKQKAPRVSIIVTAYNLDKYLKDCLASVRDLEDSDFECIIVDDASPDRCGEIADEFAAQDDRFKVIHNEKNAYLSEARNIGIRAARGRYILPLDADDMLTPRSTKLLADALDGDRSIHIAYGNVFFIEEDGAPSRYGDNDPGHSGWPVAYRYDWHERQRNLLPYASMFRKEVWKQTSGYRRRWRTAEDADFWLRAASYGFTPKMVVEADTLIYRNREGSMSRVTQQQSWGAWYPWCEYPDTRPAAASVEGDIFVHSCDPPRIAVVIPVGPGHEMLAQDAIDSVDAQTFRRWECIVVNDTGKPLDGLPSWARVVETKGSIGVAAARNRGIEASRASLFVPLDADDYLQPHALRYLLQAYEQALSGTVVYSAWYDDNGEAQKPYTPAAFHPDTLMEQLRTKGCLHAVTALYEKAAWRAVGGFDEAIDSWEDWDFQIALYEQGVCSILVPQPLFVYRKYTGTRREEMASRRDQGREAIRAKWTRYFTGGEALAACGSCAGRKSRATPQPPLQQANGKATSGSQSAMLIEYTGASVGNRRWRGRESGRFYTFGGGRNRIQYVLESDVEFFLQFQDFRLAPESAAIPSSPALLVEGS